MVIVTWLRGPICGAPGWSRPALPPSSSPPSPPCSRTSPSLCPPSNSGLKQMKNVEIDLWKDNCKAWSGLIKSINLSIFLSICLSIYSSICLSIYSSTYLSIQQYIYLFPLLNACGLDFKLLKYFWNPSSICRLKFLIGLTIIRQDELGGERRGTPTMEGN